MLLLRLMPLLLPQLLIPLLEHKLLVLVLLLLLLLLLPLMLRHRCHIMCQEVPWTSCGLQGIKWTSP